MIIFLVFWDFIFKGRNNKEDDFKKRWVLGRWKNSNMIEVIEGMLDLRSFFDIETISKI